MIDPKQIDIMTIPKAFCDGAFGNFGKDFVVFCVTSGDKIDAFATTPAVAKSISVWLSKLIAQYEEHHGTIDMKPTKIISPIQFSDLKSDDENPDLLA